MSCTVENLEKLRETLRVALRELADDAPAYLKRLGSSSGGLERSYPH